MSDNTDTPFGAPDEALLQLVDGFKRFRQDVFPEQEALFKKLASAQ